MDIVRRMQREASDAFASRSAMLLLAVLLLLDAMFITAHLLHVSGSGSALFRDRRFLMERDRSYSEWYEYLKTAIAILAFIACYRSSRQPVYRGLAIVYGLILADNSLRLHERIGQWLSKGLGATKRMFEAAPQAIGEFTVLVTFGGLGLAILFVTLRRSGPEHQARGVLFVILMLALGGFSAGLDLVHTASGSLNIDLDPAIGTVEESGELMILSISCVLAAALFSRMVFERPSGEAGHRLS